MLWCYVMLTSHNITTSKLYTCSVIDSGCGGNIIILDLYTRNTGAVKSSPGLSLVPKLKYEHLFLTSFSKMRVDLAAEVIKCYAFHFFKNNKMCICMHALLGIEWNSIQGTQSNRRRSGTRNSSFCNDVWPFFWLPKCQQLYCWKNKQKAISRPIQISFRFQNWGLYKIEARTIP